MPTIVLADDHQLVRAGLRGLLEAQRSFVVVGEASDDREALEQVDRLRPDVLLLDLVMPRMGGLEVLRRLADKASPTRSVVLSMHADEAFVIDAIRHGATGYLCKDAAPEALRDAVQDAAAGRRHVGVRLSDRAARLIGGVAPLEAGDPYDTLTPREREVLHLACGGLTSAEIGTRLRISPRTVEVHRGRVLQKLRLRNQTELVFYALRRGILPPGIG